MIKDQIIADLKKILKDLDFDGGLEPILEHPAQVSHGDYAANIAMVLWNKKSNFKTPLDLAKKLAECYRLENKPYLDKIETAPPGFVNFWLSKEFLSSQVVGIIQDKEKFGQNPARKKERIMVEFAHPNPLKVFHIGHLRNISLGESIVRLLEAGKCSVVRANYQGDVGMHIAKAIYALLHISPFKEDVSKIKGIHERVDFLGKAYTAGSLAFEENKEAKMAITDINYLVYASAQKFQKDKGGHFGSTDYMKFIHGRGEEMEKVFELWKQTRQWSLDYFETIYKRVYTHYDRYYFETDCLAGADLAKEAVKKEVLEESDGAIIFNGKPYNLDTRVFVNSLGLPTYEAKELALAEKEFSEFGALDRVIHVVGPEQSSFFKVTFKVEELLNPDKYKGRQYHLSYGWVRLKRGKMSSRMGNVVPGEWVLDEAKKEIRSQFPEMDEETAEMVAIGAVKYSMLKVSTTSEIAFSFEESISLEGNSGPYLQYTYARIQSVLKKDIKNKLKRFDLNLSSEEEEINILRSLYRFPETVQEASQNYSPNLICAYLFDLAQKFNLFYQKHPILKAEGDLREFRLGLTAATGQVIKNGLNLLGILAPERM